MLLYGLESTQYLELYGGVFEGFANYLEEETKGHCDGLRTLVGANGECDWSS